MISETGYSSQTKLIGQSLHVSEHGIGYLNLAFAANKGPKGLYSVLKALQTPISELEHKY